jgi:transposase
MSAVTVLSGPERRRRWTSAEKAGIVAESLAPGASVTEVARRHDIHSNLLHAWRRQARLAGAGAVRRSDVLAGGVEFAAVTLAEGERALPAAPGTIEIELAGRARLKIVGPVDSAMTTALVEALVKIARRR